MKRKYQKLRDSARDYPCMNCDCHCETTVLAHLGAPYSGGKGLKAPDYQSATLCYACHLRADTDPSHISDWGWRYRMVAKQWGCWIRDGLVRIG